LIRACTLIFQFSLVQYCMSCVVDSGQLFQIIIKWRIHKVTMTSLGQQGISDISVICSC